MPKPATIIDVAKRARVSMKTVSRALNDEPHVSEKAKARVLTAAAALNYRPNLFARSLASKRSFLVGLVCAPPSPAPVYVMTVQEGILSRCEAQGYNLLIRAFDPGERSVAARVLKFVEKSHVEGLVITSPMADNKALARALVEAKIPHIRISQSDTCSGSDRVGTNEEQVSAEVTRYLLRLGHERIAFVKGHPAHSGSADRLRGYLAAMGAAGIEPPKSHIQQGMFSFASGFECGERLLSSKRAPTAIFASNDYMAAGIVNVAHRIGLAIPDELSVVGFDDAPVAEQIWPALTTVRQPVRKLGELATRRLIDLIDKSEQRTDEAALECEIVVRESTGPAPSVADSPGRTNPTHRVGRSG